MLSKFRQSHRWAHLTLALSHGRVVFLWAEMEGTEPRLPGVRHALGFFFLLVAAFLVAGILLFLGFELLGIRIQDIDPQVRVVFEVVIQSLLTIGVIWFFLQLGSFHARATLSLRPCRLSIYVWAVTASLSLGIVVSQLVTYLIQSAPSLLSQDLLEMFQLSRLGDPWIYVLYALAVSLGPGLTEELAFRGFILRGLSARLSPIGSVTLTALLFALLHMDPLWILSVIPFGLFAGYLVVRSGSLYPAIAAHAVNNLWSTVEGSLMQAYNPGMDLRELVIHWTYSPAVVLVAAILFIVGIYALHHLTSQGES